MDRAIKQAVLSHNGEITEFKSGELVRCNGSKASHKFLLVADIEDPIVSIPTKTIGLYLGVADDNKDRAKVLFGEHLVFVLNIFLEKIK